MATAEKLNLFSGSIPENYDEYLDSLFFEQYAKDIAQRVAVLQPANILEIACGTGIVSQQLLKALPGKTTITSTDINPDMLAIARKKIIEGPRFNLQIADAHTLPFDNSTFDCVVAQFGVMFYTDRHKAYLEAKRVLKKEGSFIFNTWGSIPNNPIIQLVKELLDDYFPVDPPTFYDLPFSYFDVSLIKSELLNSGFKKIDTTLLNVTGSGASPTSIAIGLLKGTPIYAEIITRDADLLPDLIDALSIRLTKSYGSANLRIPLQAIIVTAK